MRSIAAIALPILLPLWAGVVIGVSLIAAPIKFQAPSLTLRTGAEIGLYTFHFLVTFEFCLLSVAIIAAAMARARRFTAITLVILAAILFLQRFWLLSVLDVHVAELLAGNVTRSSAHHTVYAIMEVAKVGLLIAAATVESRSSRLTPRVLTPQ